MDPTWEKLHCHYAHQDWADKPSIFAEKAHPFFPKSSKILEIGAGVGNDSIYFARNNFNVVSSDLVTDSLEKSISHLAEDTFRNISVQKIDLRDRLPFEDGSFDVVYSHLSLHYFDHATTLCIVSEIERLLKPQGIFAFLANSTDDPEYGSGEKIEEDFFKIGDVSKRYFNIEFTKALTHNFEAKLIDNCGQTYKDNAKNVHHLIRFIGQKI